VPPTAVLEKAWNDTSPAGLLSVSAKVSVAASVILTDVDLSILSTSISGIHTVMDQPSSLCFRTGWETDLPRMIMFNVFPVRLRERRLP
jgi:hypothetical protein